VFCWVFAGRTSRSAWLEVGGTRRSPGYPTVKLHDLRHFYASGLIAAGCDVVTVQRALGHSSTNRPRTPACNNARRPLLSCVDVRRRFSPLRAVAGRPDERLTNDSAMGQSALLRCHVAAAAPGHVTHDGQRRPASRSLRAISRSTSACSRSLRRPPSANVASLRCSRLLDLSMVSCPRSIAALVSANRSLIVRRDRRAPSLSRVANSSKCSSRRSAAVSRPSAVRSRSSATRSRSSATRSRSSATRSRSSATRSRSSAVPSGSSIAAAARARAPSDVTSAPGTSTLGRLMQQRYPQPSVPTRSSESNVKPQLGRTVKRPVAPALAPCTQDVPRRHPRRSRRQLARASHPSGGGSAKVIPTLTYHQLPDSNAHCRVAVGTVPAVQPHFPAPRGTARSRALGISRSQVRVLPGAPQSAHDVYSASVTCSPHTVSGRSSPGASVIDRWVM
jgi:hypothetical protein